MFAARKVRFEHITIREGSLWMPRLGVMLALSGAAMWLSGCGNQTAAPQAAAPRGGIAVVDLDAIATAIGQTKMVRDAVETQTNSVNQQLSKLGTSFKAQLAAKEKEFGEQPTEEQKQILANMTNQANQQFATAQNRGRQQLNQYSQQQISKVATELREQIRPICQEIATQHGLSVVVPKNEGFLLSVDPGVDITKEVIAALKAQGAARPAAAATAAAPAPAVNAAPTLPEETAAQPAEGEATR